MVAYPPRPPLTRADFPVSGENVREADKRGAGPAGLAFAKQKTGGENISQFFLSVCGARQPLRLTKQACVLPTAAHTALALDSATGGGQARGPPSSPYGESTTCGRPGRRLWQSTGLPFTTADCASLTLYTRGPSPPHQSLPLHKGAYTYHGTADGNDLRRKNYG